MGPENAAEASDRRIREAQALLEKPKVDALKAELASLKDGLDPEDVYGKESFLKVCRDFMVRAENFAEAIYPAPLP